MARHDHEHRIHVIHATAPTCGWSWGYEAVVNRLRLVYGDQIDLHVPTYRVEPSAKSDWLEAYGMKEEELPDFLQEMRDFVGVPLAPGVPDAWFSEDNTVATLAVMAAERQGRGERMRRALLRRCGVEAQDVTRPDVLDAAARECGLDVARFQADLADADALLQDVERQGEGVPHVPVGFYNLAVTDGHGRTVILDYAFDPADAEEAVDWLAQGKLRKREPTDVLAYLREHGPTPALEVARVFRLDEKEAEARLGALVREGAAESVVLAASPFWRAKEAAR